MEQQTYTIREMSERLDFRPLRFVIMRRLDF